MRARCAVQDALAAAAAIILGCGDGSSGRDAGRDGMSDAPAIDAPMIDAPMIDAPMIDAPMIDAPMIDAPTFDAPIDAPDARPDAVVGDGGTCTLAPQGGCSTGQKCTVDPMTNMITCLPAGTTPAGQACTMETQCVAGTACVNLGVGRECVTFCRADQTHAFTDCASMGNGSACFFQLQDSLGNPITGANVCGIPCNPLEPGTTCGGPIPLCAYDDLTWTNPYGTCLPSGTLGAGMACTLIGQCIAPLQCLRTAPNTFSCRHLCDNLHACPTGACTAFSTTSAYGLGFCSN